MRALLEGTLDAGERERRRRTSLNASAVAPARRRVRRAFRTATCSRRRARRSPSIGRFRVIARVILSAFERPGAARARDVRRTSAARDGHRSRLLSRASRPHRVSRWRCSRRRRRRAPPATRRAARSTGERGRVALLTGCVMEGLFTETNRATERVLVANDYAIAAAPGQRCCGALHAHAGDADARAATGARPTSRRSSDAGVDYICVNAAGCGAMMKEYAHLLADDPEWSERAEDRFAAKVRDVSELARRRRARTRGERRAGAGGVRRARAICCTRSAIANPPLDVLRAIPELELVPLNESEMCCGSAGIYNLVEPETSDVVLERKMENIAAAERRGRRDRQSGLLDADRRGASARWIARLAVVTRSSCSIGAMRATVGMWRDDGLGLLTNHDGRYVHGSAGMAERRGVPVRDATWTSRRSATATLEIGGQDVVLAYADVPPSTRRCARTAIVVDRSHRGRMRVLRREVRRGAHRARDERRRWRCIRDRANTPRRFRPRDASSPTADLRLPSASYLVDTPPRAWPGLLAMVKKYVNPRALGLSRRLARDSRPRHLRRRGAANRRGDHRRQRRRARRAGALRAPRRDSRGRTPSDDRALPDIGLEGYELFVPFEMFERVWERRVDRGRDAGRARRVGDRARRSRASRVGNRHRRQRRFRRKRTSTSWTRSRTPKGCYIGQEVVARVHFRGHVNRHLRGLRAASADAPPTGAPSSSTTRAITSATCEARCRRRDSAASRSAWCGERCRRARV